MICSRFVRILTLYADAGNRDRLYDAEFALVEDAGYDLGIAGARLLGRDAATLCLDDTNRRIQNLLREEVLVDKLILQMNHVMNPLGDRSDPATEYVHTFRRGFLGL